MYRWHQRSAFEASTDPVVDTFWFSPCSLKKLISEVHKSYLDSLKSVGLMTNEWSTSLLDNSLQINVMNVMGRYNVRERGSHVERSNQQVQLKLLSSH